MVYGWEPDPFITRRIDREWPEIPAPIIDFLIGNEIELIGDLLCHTEQSLTEIVGFQSDWLPIIKEALKARHLFLGSSTEYSRNPLHDFIQSQNDF